MFSNNNITCRNTNLLFFTLVYAALFLFHSHKAFAQNCSGPTKIISVPWMWTLTQTLGQNKSFTFVDHNNPGSIGNALSTPSSFMIGSFTIGKIHNPPLNCGRQSSLPTSTNLAVLGSLDGNYRNLTTNGSIGGVGFPTNLTVEANINILPSFPTKVFGGLSQGPFSDRRSDTLSVSDGQTIAYTGSTTVSSLYGVPFPFFFDITATSQISISGSLVKKDESVLYKVPVTVPEPITIIASSLAIGFGSLCQRVYAKKCRK